MRSPKNIYQNPHQNHNRPRQKNFQQPPPPATVESDDSTTAPAQPSQKDNEEIKPFFLKNIKLILFIYAVCDGLSSGGIPLALDNMVENGIEFVSVREFFVDKKNTAIG